MAKIYALNARSEGTRKPNVAFYRKSMGEQGPTWSEKRDFVRWLINDSNVSPQGKLFLQSSYDWIPKYQLRGFKYGLVSSTFVFFFFPVVRRAPFVQRFAFSMLPMVFFMKWGYTWGHENFWRRAKEVVVTYEIYSGVRSKFTMK